MSRAPNPPGEFISFHFHLCSPGVELEEENTRWENPGSFSTPLSTLVTETGIYFPEPVTTRASLICPEHFVDQTEEHSPGSRAVLAQRRETPAGPRCCSETRNHLGVQRLRKEIVTVETSRASIRSCPAPGDAARAPGGCWTPTARVPLPVDSEGPTPSAGRGRQEFPALGPESGLVFKKPLLTPSCEEGRDSQPWGVGIFLPFPPNTRIADPSATSTSRVFFRGVSLSAVGSVHRGFVSLFYLRLWITAEPLSQANSELCWSELNRG